MSHKNTLLFLTITGLGVALSAIAAVTVNPITCNVNVASPSAAWGDFNWNWRGQDDQSITIYFKSGTAVYTGISPTATTRFKMLKQAAGPSGTTNVVVYLKTDGFTLTTSNITFSIVHTNIPPDGSYKCEVQQDDGTYIRSFAKGMINVSQSIYRGDDASWTNSTYYQFLSDLNYSNTLTEINQGAYIQVTGTGRARTVAVTGMVSAADADYLGALTNASITNGTANSVTVGARLAAFTVRTNYVHTNDPVYLAALTNSTIAAATSNAVSVAGGTLTINVRTNYVHTNDSVYLAAFTNGAFYLNAVTNITLTESTSNRLSLANHIADFTVSTNWLTTNNLPRRTTLWGDEALGIEGTIITNDFDASQKYNNYTYGMNMTNLEAYGWSFVASSGSYVMSVLCYTDAGFGIGSWYLDGSLIATLNEASGASVYNVVHTTNVTITTSGRHLLKVVGNGAVYDVTKVWFAPLSGD